MKNAKIIVKSATPSAAKMAAKLVTAQKFADFDIEKVRARKNANAAK